MAEREGSDLSAWEELSMITIGASVLAAVATVATWHKLLAFLVDQNVLVPASASPLVRLPAGDGIGLDAPRLAIAFAAVVFAVAAGISALRRRGDVDERSR